MKRAACACCVVALLAFMGLAGCQKQPVAGDIQTFNLAGNVPLDMVWVPAGTFTMGSPNTDPDRDPKEAPQHAVNAASGFWVGRYEVSKRQWQAVMETTPWSGSLNVLLDPDSPVVDVSWDDAQAFVVALNTYTGLTFRMPSEAEWEYACRADTTSRLYWGDDPTYVSIDDYAWWQGNANSAGQKFAHLVGQKLPNAWGLYDMSGNVWEWCEDDWHSDYTGAPSDTPAWVDAPRGSERVLRGGAWLGAGGVDCRSASRIHNVPSYMDSGIGFRIAR